MEDKLRLTLELAGDWTPEEIEQYERNRKSKLGPLYASAGIPINNPEARAEYLKEVLNLKIEDYSTIITIAKEKGRLEVLKTLEKWVIETFF